ncbi:hypothetical protein MRX96_046240 [Rhipicephalus microplus]
MAASNGRGVASPAVVASNASETRMQPAKKPRRCFSAHEDLCLLREVAAAKPFGDDIKWVHVLAAVNRAVGRELTLRGIKDRVDILLGYWKLQDSKNLKKGAACAARRRRLGAERPVNTDELPGVTLSDDGTGDGALGSAAELLQSVYLPSAASPGAEPGQENEQQEQRASPEPTQQQRPPSTELQRRQPASVQHALPGTSKGKEEASDVQQRFDPPAVLVIYSPESCLLPGYDPSNWQNMPFGHIIAWYFRAWTLLWPLKYTFWFLVGRHIGRAVPSMKAQQFVSGAHFA